MYIFSACSKTKNSNTEQSVSIEESAQVSLSPELLATSQTLESMVKRGSMRIFINDKELSVNWEDNAAIDEIYKDVQTGDINISMSMYGGFEQVGEFKKSYPRSDRQITAESGDIVLYEGNKLVIFYGKNTWSYTRLGIIELPEKELTELLSKNDVMIKLTK